MDRYLPRFYGRCKDDRRAHVRLPPGHGWTEGKRHENEKFVSRNDRFGSRPPSVVALLRVRLTVNLFTNFFFVHHRIANVPMLKTKARHTRARRLVSRERERERKRDKTSRFQR